MLYRLNKFILRFLQDRLIKQKIVKALFLAIFLNISFGFLFYLAEKSAQPNLTLADSIWWAMVTMTTVGYGDFSATTFTGRFIISYLCMVLGIGIIGYVIGFLAEHFILVIAKTKKGLMSILDKNHIIICSFPSEAKVLDVIKELRALENYQKKSIVIISDIIQELPESLQIPNIHFIKGSPTDEKILMKANILKCDGVLVLADESNSQSADEKSFTIGTIVELIGQEHHKYIKTTVEVVQKKNIKLIEKSTVAGVISNDGVTSRLLVQEFLNPGVHDIIQQLLSNNMGSQFFIVDTKLQGYQLVKIQLEIIKDPSNIQLIGIVKNDQKILNPSKNLTIEKNDKLILLAEKANDFSQIEETILNQ